MAPRTKKAALTTADVSEPKDETPKRDEGKKPQKMNTEDVPEETPKKDDEKKSKKANKLFHDAMQLADQVKSAAASAVLPESDGSTTASTPQPSRQKMAKKTKKAFFFCEHKLFAENVGHFLFIYYER